MQIENENITISKESRMILSIIIPCYNEKNSIFKLIKLILEKVKYNKQIILVDDFSDDGTREIIKQSIEDKIAKVIYHSKNCGKGQSIISAIPYANGEITIIQDADLEYDPDDINKIVEFFIKHKSCKVVYGSRVLNRENYKNLNFSKKLRVLSNYFLTLFNNIMNNQVITDAHTCYKAVETKLLKTIILKEQRFAFCAELNTKLSKKNIHIYEIPINYKGRTIAEGKKISFKDGIRSIYAIIKYNILKN